MLVLLLACSSPPPPPAPEPVVPAVPAVEGPDLADTPHFRLVRVLRDRACGLYSDGTARCWGAFPGDVRVDGPFVDVLPLQDSVLGLRPDGSVEVLEGRKSVRDDLEVEAARKGEGLCAVQDGRPTCGEPPPGSFVAAAFGGGAGCALTAEGRVTCWGAMPPDRVPYDDGTPAPTGQAGAGAFVPVRDGSLVREKDDQLFRGPFGPTADTVSGIAGHDALIAIPVDGGLDVRVLRLELDAVDAVAYVDLEGDGALEMLVIGRRVGHWTPAGVDRWDPANHLVAWTGSALVRARAPESAEGEWQEARTVKEAKVALGL